MSIYIILTSLIWWCLFFHIILKVFRIRIPFKRFSFWKSGRVSLIKIGGALPIKGSGGLPWKRETFWIWNWVDLLVINILINLYLLFRFIYYYIFIISMILFINIVFIFLLLIELIITILIFILILNCIFFLLITI